MYDDSGRMERYLAINKGYGISYHPPVESNRNPDDQANTSEEVNTFATDMWRIMDAAGNLLLQKHHDYGPKNISQSPGGPLNGLRVRMWDKVARINNLIDSDVAPSNESLRDSFVDLLNYSAIALMVLDGTWPKGND